MKMSHTVGFSALADEGYWLALISFICWATGSGSSLLQRETGLLCLHPNPHDCISIKSDFGTLIESKRLTASTQSRRQLSRDLGHAFPL